MKFFGVGLGLATLVLTFGYFGPSFLAVIAAVFGAAVSFAFFWKMVFADHNELRKNQRRSRTLASAILGRAKTRDDWLPDARVQGGMVFSRKHNRIEISGKLSNESLDRAFR